MEEKGVNYFIPMRFVEYETLDGKKHRKLTPAVHNLLFIEKEFTEKELLERVKDCTIPFLLVRDRSTRRCYEIPDCEMLEFRAVCDPNYKGTLYVDTVTAEARPGQAVRVQTHAIQEELLRTCYVSYYRRHATYSQVVLRKNQLIITLRSSAQHLVVGHFMSDL